MCLSPRWVAAGAYALLIAALLGCGGPGQYVWLSDLPPEASSLTDYIINFGDSLSIRVYGHEDLSVHEKVRSDGRIALPLIGEVEARGKRPNALRGEIEGRLKDYVVSPSVVLTVDEATPMTVVFLGEFTRPGVFTMEANTRLVQALGVAGGLTEFASRDSLFIVRRQPSPVRIRFNYQWVLRNLGHTADFPLHPGDYLVAE
jgi:polysaccharide biosynthesis/export protein